MKTRRRPSTNFTSTRWTAGRSSSTRRSRSRREAAASVAAAAATSAATTPAVVGASRAGSALLDDPGRDIRLQLPRVEGQLLSRRSRGGEDAALLRRPLLHG